MDFNIIVSSSLIIFNLLIIIFNRNLIKLFNVYDKPDKTRKFHQKETSLFGGTIVLLNLILFIILDYFILNQSNTSEISIELIFFGSIFFYFFGLVDDKKNLNSNLKFIIEILVIYLIVVFDNNLLIEKIYFHSINTTIILGKFSHIFTVLSIIIFINALNMFDGINLQSGSYCLIVFIFLLFFSNFNLLLLSMIIALITFLYLNYKSKLFLGDNGTYLLGFLISYLIIYEAKSGYYYELSADKIFLVMLLPGLDLIRLTLLRASKKKHPFSPDRNHIHHLLLNNVGYKKTIIYLITYKALLTIAIFILGDHLLYVIIFFILLYIATIIKYEK